MGQIELKRIELNLRAAFGELVDMNDFQGRPASELDQIRLSRTVAAYALAHVSDIDSPVAANHVVDGFNDNGIDALYFDAAEKQFYVVQSKWISSGNGSPDTADVHKFVHGFRDLINLNFCNFNKKVKALQDTIYAAVEDSGTTFTLILAYTGVQALSEHAQGLLNDLIQEMNDISPMVSVLVLRQQDLYKSIAGFLTGTPINLEVGLREWGTVKSPYVAYYGQVEAEDVAKWYEENGIRIVDKNLRKFLGKTDVNDAIMLTLEEQPEQFWYFNNGITAICSRAAKKPIYGDRRDVGIFEFEGVAVVNGAQTIGCIYELFSKNPELLKNANVLIRFISLENAPDELALDITRATNTQNKIELRDFAALDPQQERIKHDLILDGIEYAYKSGDRTPPKESGFSITEASIALACAQESVDLAVQAKREVSKLWQDITKPPYTHLFRPTVSGLYCWKAVQIMRTVEKRLDLKKKHFVGRERLIAVHGNRFILYKVFRALPSPALNDPNFSVPADIDAKVNGILREMIDCIEKDFSGSYPGNLFNSTSTPGFWNLLI